jgi:hypothetical protein
MEKLYQVKNITSRNIHPWNSVLRIRIRIRMSLYHFRKLDPDPDLELDPDQELDPQQNEKRDLDPQ